jgi:hypothetical protein
VNRCGLSGSAGHARRHTVSLPPSCRIGWGCLANNSNFSLAGGRDRYCYDSGEVPVRSSLLGTAAAHLAQHSAVAKSLITAEEDSAEAAIACCTTLRREHAIGLDIAVRAVHGDKVRSSRCGKCPSFVWWYRLSRAPDHSKSLNQLSISAGAAARAHRHQWLTRLQVLRIRLCVRTWVITCVAART